MKLVLGLVAAFALCVMSSCVQESDTATGSIQGIVTNKTNSEPIQGVNISLSPTGLSAVTGSDGRYEFQNLASGLYTVQAMKTGFESNTKTINITGGQIASGDMMLSPDNGGFKLNVEYLDFGSAFSQLNFKIINTSYSKQLYWTINESLSWLTPTPNTGELNAGGEVTVVVTIDRALITQEMNSSITVSSRDGQNIVLPIHVAL